MRQFKTVFQFELMSYLKSKPYIITTMVLVCLMLLLGAVPTALHSFGIIGGDDAAVKQKEAADAPIGVYDAQSTLTAEALDLYLGEGMWTRIDSADPDEVEEAVSSGKYALVLEVDGLAYTVTMPGSGAMSFSSGKYNNLVKQGYQSAMLNGKGFSASEIDAVVNAAPAANYVTVGKDAWQSYWLAFALLMTLYMAILLYGQYVMTSVVTEKTSKTVELLIISVKPVYLIFGKVVGAGLAGLTQLSAVVLAGAISFSVSKNSLTAFAPSVVEMFNPSTTGLMLIYALIFFMLGFFVFAFLYAAFASTVSRAEDVNTVALFPMLPFIAAFMVAITGMSDPVAIHITVCSFIPFLSPMVMFMRICMTDVPFYQILASIAINSVTIVIVGVFSAKLYRTGVLMYGTKPTLRNIWKNIRRA